MADSKIKLKSLRIFIACPGDVAAEKKLVIKIADSLQNIAINPGYLLKVSEWQQVVPGMGRPQEIIFDQIPAKSWDLFIGILWLRFGAPSGGIDPKTGKADDSGTYEEFRVANDLWQAKRRPRIICFKCARVETRPRIGSPPTS
jgi:hypothetical protein